MSLITARLRDGHTIQFHPQPLGSGGEKVVFPTADGRQVVCLYKNNLRDRHERRSRLEKILGTFNPTWGAAHAEFWRNHFCWPTALIDADSGLPPQFLRAHDLHDPPLGLITPIYPPQFFFRLPHTGEMVEKNAKWFTGPRARRFLPAEERGTLLGYLRVCTKVARAVARLHHAGVAHADLSHRNVLIDPRGGDACIIDLDSLVVPGIMPPVVLGTPGYLAPEVLSRHAHPSILTECHALAVLIYETLLTRHPLVGSKIHSLSAEEDDRLSFGEKALFVEHSTDRSNQLRPPPSRSFTALGPALSPLIQRAFVDGLHQPSLRPTAAEWEHALYRTFDHLHPSPEPGEWMIVAPGLPLRCPLSGLSLSQAVPIAHFYRELLPHKFVQEKHSLTIHHHLPLRRWHTTAYYWPGPGDDRSRQGYFAHERGKWWLINESGYSFQVAGGSPVAHGEAVQIVSGLRLRTAAEPIGRLLVFDFLDP